MNALNNVKMCVKLIDGFLLVALILVVDAMKILPDISNMLYEEELERVAEAWLKGEGDLILHANPGVNLCSCPII